MTHTILEGSRRLRCNAGITEAVFHSGEQNEVRVSRLNILGKEVNSFLEGNSRVIGISL